MTATPTFRMATPEDAAALSAFYARCFTHTFGHLYAPADLAAFIADWQPARWERPLTDGHAYAVRVAELGGEIVGHIMLSPPSLPFDTGGRAAIELKHLYIRADLHGAGVAQALADWALAEARRRGAQDFYVSVFSENHRAIRFYARQGFEKIGEYKFQVGDHYDDEFVMRLRLAP